MGRTIDHLMAYRYDRAVAFYALATIIPWAFWFIAAYLSQLSEQTAAVQVWTAVLGVCGLIAPIFVVVLLVRRRADLRKDILQRLLPRRISWIYLVVTLLLLLASILAAQAVSLLLGYSPEQFQFQFREASHFQPGCCRCGSRSSVQRSFKSLPGTVMAPTRCSGRCPSSQHPWFSRSSGPCGTSLWDSSRAITTTRLSKWVGSTR